MRRRRRSEDLPEVVAVVDGRGQQDGPGGGGQADQLGTNARRSRTVAGSAANGGPGRVRRLPGRWGVRAARAGCRRMPRRPAGAWRTTAPGGARRAVPARRGVQGRAPPPRAARSRRCRPLSGCGGRSSRAGRPAAATRAVLLAAAVDDSDDLGEILGAASAAHGAELPAAALEPAVSARVLTVGATPPVVEFRHPLLRSAVLWAALPTEVQR
ncbi:hypothetical protein GXW82_43050, partial [Streptacidiphilus sp. 4-A2]|nr:hypothetical protein [Streptacidiphilus sp. 4-A2]